MIALFLFLMQPAAQNVLELFWHNNRNAYSEDMIFQKERKKKPRHQQETDGF